MAAMQFRTDNVCNRTNLDFVNTDFEAAAEHH